MRLAVVGSINTDMTVTAERIPLKGETLMGSSLSYIPGGKGANQAVAMAKLGAEVEMFGCVGDDSNGEKMLENLKAVGVGTEHIQILKGVPTGIAMITVGDNDSIKSELEKFDMVVLQHEIPLETVHYVIEFCYEKGIKIVLNPAPAAAVPMEIIDKVTYVTPNEHEAVLIFGDKLSTEDLLRKYPEKLVITQGSRGVSTCLKDGRILNIPARKAQVVDTTGAGDTLNGAFSVQIAEGKAIEDALTYANVAASLSTEKFGAQTGMPTAEEVETELKK